MAPLAKVALGEIPMPSTSFTSEVTLQLVGTTLSLTFEYDDDGTRRQAGLQFDGVRAHSHRVEGASTAWHVEGAYDTVVEVLDSPWLSRVVDLAVQRGHPPGELHHFMIYLDSHGAYEAIARTWALTNAG